MKSKLPRLLLHLRGVLRDHHVVGAQPDRVLRLAGRRREHDDPGAERAARTSRAMCPSPPRPTTPTFCPLRTFQCRSGE